MIVFCRQHGPLLGKRELALLGSLRWGGARFAAAALLGEHPGGLRAAAGKRAPLVGADHCHEITRAMVACYVQLDGEHISPRACCCRELGPEECLIDAHRIGARREAVSFADVRKAALGRAR